MSVRRQSICLLLVVALTFAATDSLATMPPLEFSWGFEIGGFHFAAYGDTEMSWIVWGGETPHVLKAPLRGKGFLAGLGLAITGFVALILFLYTRRTRFKPPTEQAASR